MVGASGRTLWQVAFAATVLLLPACGPSSREGNSGPAGSMMTGGAIGTGGSPGAVGNGGAGGITSNGGHGGSTGGSAQPLSLGASCTDSALCGSGYCVAGLCCEAACAGTCMTCGTDGKCNLAPVDDAACGVIACPLSSPCQTYPAGLTTSRCIGFNQCASSAQCIPSYVPRGMTCDTGIVCDGYGSCSVSVNGSTCSSNSECESAQCVGGICGKSVSGCAAFADYAQFVAIAGLLNQSWPSGNPPGEALLLGGEYTDPTLHICFDSEELTPSYNDGSNAMITIPTDAVVGSHTLWTIVEGGQRVSTPLPVLVLDSFGPEPSVITSAGGQPPQPEPIFQNPNQVVVPIPAMTFPPFDNSGADSFGGDLQLARYTMDASPTYMTASGILSWGGGASIRIHGSYDVADRRLLLTFDVPCDAGQPATLCPIDYVALLSCWADQDTLNGEPDLCHVPSMYAGRIAIRMFFFPVGPSGHQGEIHM